MMRRRTGFTLAELMVVLSIIGLVVAIALPLFSRVYAAQRNVVCQGNLEKLGQACGAMFASRQLKGMTGTGLGTLEWQQQIHDEWVSKSKEVFHCPEDDGTGTGTGMGKKASLAGYYMDVCPGGKYAGSVCLNEDENEWVWKLSQTQYDKFMDMAKKNGRQSHGYVHPGYAPDGNPNRYWFAFEDMKWSSGADRDFQDINFLVETKGVNITITVRNYVTGYEHYLYLGAPGDPNRKKLFPEKLSKCDGLSATVKGQSDSDYGMNSMAGQINPGSNRKLLIMDYETLLAAGSPHDETSGDRPEQLKEFWSPDPKAPDAPLKFARHFRKCNVLFADGAVRLTDPEDIHPADPVITATHWDP